MEETKFSEENLPIASIFERQWLSNIGWKDFDRDMTRRLAAAAEDVAPDQLKEQEI